MRRIRLVRRNVHYSWLVKVYAVRCSSLCARLDDVDAKLKKGNSRFHSGA